MWGNNEIHATEIEVYNEKPIVRDDGGLTLKEDYDMVNLRVVLVPMQGRFRQLETGRFWEDVLRFQVSKHELNKKEFTIISGKTHAIYNGYDFRITVTQDALNIPTVQLIECTGKRMIPVDDLK